jgi:hypothetical protein
MPGSQLNTRFDSNYGDRRASEQIFMIPFREGRMSGISWSGVHAGAIGA